MAALLPIAEEALTEAVYVTLISSPLHSARQAAL